MQPTRRKKSAMNIKKRSFKLEIVTAKCFILLQTLQEKTSNKFKDLFYFSTHSETKMSLIASLLEKALDTSLTWFLLFIVIVLINHLRKLRNLPPGPWGYPIVGIFPMIKNHIHLTFFEYSKTYGKICSFKMGMANHVVISDLDLMKKAMRSKLFVSRPHGPLNSILGGYGE